MEICRKSPDLVKIGQKYWAMYIFIFIGNISRRESIVVQHSVFCTADSDM